MEQIKHFKELLNTEFIRMIIESIRHSLLFSIIYFILKIMLI